MKSILLSTFVIAGMLTTSLEASDFRLGDVIRTVNQIERAVQGRPGPPRSGIQPLPYPLPHPQPSPIHKPYPGPKPGPICERPAPRPRPRPVPICERPAPHPERPIGKHPVCRPPQRLNAMRLTNQAGADVYVRLNKGEFQKLSDGEFLVEKSKSPGQVILEYDYGDGLVMHRLDPNGDYAVEWQGDILALIELDGVNDSLARRD